MVTVKKLLNFISQYSEANFLIYPKLKPGEENRIMHVSLPISKETILMGSDTGGEWAPSYLQGNNFSISITADSKSEAEKLFKGLSSDGTVTMPLAKTFWTDLFGTLTDKFGINWMVSFSEAKSS
jgi:PhnB protein